MIKWAKCTHSISSLFLKISMKLSKPSPVEHDTWHILGPPAIGTDESTAGCSEKPDSESMPHLSWDINRVTGLSANVETADSLAPAEGAWFIAVLSSLRSRSTLLSTTIMLLQLDVILDGISSVMLFVLKASCLASYLELILSITTVESDCLLERLPTRSGSSHLSCTPDILSVSSYS